MNWHFQYRDKIFICLTNVFLIAVINKTFGVNMSSVCVWGGSYRKNLWSNTASNSNIKCLLLYIINY